MRSYFVLILIFLLALLQGAFLPLNLVLLMILIWAAIRPVRETIIIAFVSGLLLDCAWGTTWGISSLIFLLTAYILHLYSRKFDPLHPAFLPFFVFLSASLYSLITRHYFYWVEALILAFLVFLMRPLIKYFSLGFEKRGIRLKI